MRPDDRLPTGDEPLDAGNEMPLDAALEALHEELDAAGAQSRRALYGRTQPTRLYTNDLRARLMGTFAVPAAADALGGQSS